MNFSSFSACECGEKSYISLPFLQLVYRGMVEFRREHERQGHTLLVTGADGHQKKLDEALAEHAETEARRAKLLSEAMDEA